MKARSRNEIHIYQKCKRKLHFARKRDLFSAHVIENSEKSTYKLYIDEERVAKPMMGDRISTTEFKSTCFNGIFYYKTSSFYGFDANELCVLSPPGTKRV